jgi:PPK2 family polyphosphate:nucleotide phosphotransferase
VFEILPTGPLVFDGPPTDVPPNHSEVEVLRARYIALRLKKLHFAPGGTFATRSVRRCDLLRRVAHCGSVDAGAHSAMFGARQEARQEMPTNFSKELLVTPGKKVTLGKWDPDDTLGWEKGRKMTASLDKSCERLDKLQYLLYAEHKRALLVVLQGLDAAGKDGAIRHVMSGVNPQGCTVTPFKKPSPEEMEHDFLWRIHKAVPEYGDIGIFNRSYYEDVLIVRVHNLVPKDVWSRRYDQINEFEKLLQHNNIRIVKFFLHISKEEQKKRFQQRIDDPDRRWKISEADFAERKFWDDYTAAYEAVLTKCSTDHSPWYVIPSNKKWFRNLAISHILVETLEAMHMKFPAPTVDVKKLKWK